MHDKILWEQMNEYLLKIGSTRYSIHWIYSMSKYKFGEEALGFAKSLSDKPIKVKVLCSFKCYGGGGYIVQDIENNKIRQVRSVKRPDDWIKELTDFRNRELELSLEQGKYLSEKKK